MAQAELAAAAARAKVFAQHLALRRERLRSIALVICALLAGVVFLVGYVRLGRLTPQTLVADPVTIVVAAIAAWMAIVAPLLLLRGAMPKIEPEIDRADQIQTRLTSAIEYYRLVTESRG